MPAQHVMDATEGAAWRYQLDAMITVLNEVDDAAAEVDDAAVIRLIASLYAAREAAAEIEMRSAATKRGGIRLVKS